MLGLVLRAIAVITWQYSRRRAVLLVDSDLTSAQKKEIMDWASYIRNERPRAAPRWTDLERQLRMSVRLYTHGRDGVEELEDPDDVGFDFRAINCLSESEMQYW